MTSTISRSTPVRPLSALDAIFLRRSVRAFAPQPLDESTIRSLLDAAVQAPTAMHTEPWRFVIIQDARTLRRYSDIAKETWAKEAASHADLHPGADAAARSAFAAALAGSDGSVFYDAPVLIAICARSLGPFVEADCWLAAENLMLAACALGLGTCCIGSAVPALNGLEARADLSIPPDVSVVAPIVVGVPTGAGIEVPRKTPKILSWK